LLRHFLIEQRYECKENKERRHIKHSVNLEHTFLGIWI
jgi:hypothetical protein